MAKYHLTKNGYYAKCTANSRPCPLGGGHIGEQEYQALKAADSAEIQHNVEAPEGSYYATARDAYERVNAEAALYNQLEAETQAFATKLYAERGLDPKKDTWYAVDTKLKEAKEDALKTLRGLYEKHGVDRRKVGYIIDDIRNNQGLAPAIRKQDRYDKDILAKTTAAVEEAKTNPEYLEAAKRFEEAHALQKAHRKVADERDKFRRSRAMELGKNGIVSHVSETSLTSAKEKFNAAISLKRAGVPDNAKAVATSSIKQNQLVVDSKGHIKNAWYQNDDGSVERIIGYKEPPGPLVYGAPSGHLFTDRGTEIKSGTHYANYRSYSTGRQQIVISEMPGKPLKADVFSIYSEIDTGD